MEVVVLRKDGYALLMALSLAIMVGLGAALLAVRTAQEAEQSRLEAKTALARIALDGQINALLLRMTGEVRELLRESLQNADIYYSDPTTMMAPLAQAMQSRVDALVCSSGQQRIYFSRQACKEDLPANIRLSSPALVSETGHGAIRRYRLPFVIYAQAQQGEARQERYISGAYEFDLGAALPSHYALFVDNAYQQGGELLYFDDSLALEGRLHVAGILGVRGKPWFAGPVSSGSCPALAVDGTCVGDVERGMVFAKQGFVSEAGLLPNPDRPCLGPDCPVWGGGLDLGTQNLRSGALDISGWQPDLSLVGDVQRMHIWPEDGWQYLEICKVTCERYRAIGGKLQRWVVSEWLDMMPLQVMGGATRLRLKVVGSIASLQSGNFGIAIADGISLEILVKGSVRITDSLAYENSPCSFVGGRSGQRLVGSRCGNLGASGRLTLISEEGDIRLASNEDNPRLHGHFLAPRGTVGAEDPTPRGGAVFVVGGLFMGRWEGWGQQLSLTYDPRFALQPSLAEERPLMEGVLGVFLEIEGEQQQN